MPDLCVTPHHGLSQAVDSTVERAHDREKGSRIGEAESCPPVCRGDISLLRSDAGTAGTVRTRSHRSQRLCLVRWDQVGRNLLSRVLLPAQGLERNIALPTERHRFPRGPHQRVPGSEVFA